MPLKNTTNLPNRSASRKTPRQDANVSLPIDDFKAPKIPPGRLGATAANNQMNYDHVKECAGRISQKLEAKDTPPLVREVLEAYLCNLGAKYFKFPRVALAAYEEVCLVVSHPPFPLRLECATSDGYFGNVEELLNFDQKRSLAEARRLQRHGFLK